MLAAEEGWGRETGRPYLPRAFSVASAEAVDGGVRLGFLADPVGPGTRRLCDLQPGQRVWINGPLGRPFSEPRDVLPRCRAGRSSSAAASAWRRWRCCARSSPTATSRSAPCSASATSATREASTISSPAARSGWPPTTATPATAATSPTCSRVLLEGDAARSAVVYSCGPPPMLEAVRAMCAERGVACQLALEAPMACGFGACFGCAVPLAEGGYMRLCVDGPVVDGGQIETALIPGSGH